MKGRDHQHLSDAELLQRFRADGDNEWLGALLSRYTLLLYGLSMKYLKNESDARDAVQQIFLKAINELGKYDVTYFKSWLYMIAKNHCLLKLKEAGRMTMVDADTQAYKLKADDRAHEERADWEYKLNQLEQALTQLNEEQRVCVTLFYLEKLSYAQICERTGFSALQVKSFIQNGKRNLKLIMERNMNNEG